MTTLIKFVTPKDVYDIKITIESGRSKFEPGTIKNTEKHFKKTWEFAISTKYKDFTPITMVTLKNRSLKQDLMIHYQSLKFGLFP